LLAVFTILQNSYTNMQYYLNCAGIMASIGRDSEVLQNYLKAYMISPDEPKALEGIDKMRERIKDD